MKLSNLVCLLLGMFLLISCESQQSEKKSSLDYVNPNLGGIGHLLVATDPVVRLPQGSIQLASNPWPEIYDRYISHQVFSFALRDVIRYGTTTVPSWIMATTGEIQVTAPEIASDYDHDFETVTPYYSKLLLEDYDINVEYTVSDQVSYYRFTFPENPNSHILLGSNAKFSIVDETTVEGEETAGNRTYYFYAKFDKPFKSFGTWRGEDIFSDSKSAAGDNTAALTTVAAASNELPYAQTRWRTTGAFANYATAKDEPVEVKIAVSGVSMEDARQNMEKEIPQWNFETIKNNAKSKWEESLDLFKVEGGTEAQRIKFYTGIYFSVGGERLLGRMNIKQDDLNERARRYAAQSKSDLYPPTSVQGGMFQHGNIVFNTAAYLRGARDFDVEKAYENMKIEFLESTKLPWRKGPSTVLDKFYLENGFFPALPYGGKEWVAEVHPHERRQSVTVTLQAAYESWCIAQMAKALGKTEDYDYFIKHAHDYQNVFNPQINFMAPKTEDGKWVTPFNTILAGGQGGRDYFAELNTWIYTWYVTHDIQGLINLMGGRDQFTKKLDSLYVQQYQTSKYFFLGQFPDQTGLIGNYAHGNEFSRQIPYLYNYSGAPWKTQKQVREIMDVWYGTGPLGTCGDEDTGLMSHWYICSAMGIYADPMIPNYPIWLIGSPVFSKSTITVGENKTFVIEAPDVSAQNKYVQSATLNGEPLNKAWFDHADILKGGKLVLNMGPRPNKQWASSLDAIPPSMSKPQ